MTGNQLTRLGSVQIRDFVPRDKSNNSLNPAKRPFIKDNTIFLPASPYYGWEVVAEGTEAVLISRDDRAFGGYGPWLYIGERNRRPFLYGFNSRVTAPFAKSGVEGLATSLVPKRMARIFDTHGGDIDRYGNLFLGWVPLRTEDALAFINILRGGDLKLEKVSGLSLFGTGHVFTGKCGFVRERDTPWVFTTSGRVTTDCGEKIKISSPVIIQLARHLNTSLLNPYKKK